MDFDMVNVARAGVAAYAREGRARVELVRVALVRKRAADANASATPAPAAVEAVALSMPGAAEALGAKAKSLKSASPAALLRLVLSPKVRGAGVSVDRVRKAQQAGLALVANAVLQSQAISMRQWLGHDEGVDSDVRGFVAMWDEAC